MPPYQITLPTQQKQFGIRDRSTGILYITTFHSSLAGKEVTINTDGLKKGDTLYFSDKGSQIIWGDVITFG